MSGVGTDRPLRVAMLSSISWRTPPRGYGPWELVTSLLTEGLIRRGVDVTLFATGESQTAGRLVSVVPRGYSEEPGMDAKVWECLHIAEVFERARAGEFDLIHNQFDFLPLSYSGLVDVPVVTTIHGFSSERIVPVYQKYNDRGYYVAISEADKHPSLRYAATIHHGIPMDEFVPRVEPPTGGDYLLFFGRIHPDKGVVEALDLAEKVGQPLVLAGIIQDQGYFDRYVEPRLDGTRVRYVGPVGPGAAADVAGRGGGAAAPDQFRRTVRPERGGSDGLRDARAGASARVHAGDRPARGERVFTAFAARRRRRSESVAYARPAGGPRFGGAAVRRGTHGG